MTKTSDKTVERVEMVADFEKQMLPSVCATIAANPDRYGDELAEMAKDYLKDLLTRALCLKH